MIERYNFYDFYGYLLPGLVALGLFGAPVAMMHADLDIGLVEGTAALAAAYVLGFVLHLLTRGILPTDTDGAGEELGRLPHPVRAAIHQSLQRDFDLGGNPGATAEAFQLARAFVRQHGRGSYVEQYHGMYALTRSVAVTTLVGAAYYSGLVVAPHLPGGLARVVLGIAVVVAVFAALPRETLQSVAPVAADARWLRPTATAMVSFAAGAAMLLPPPGSAVWVLGGAVCSIVICATTWNSVGHFDRATAQAVWREYLVASRARRAPPPDILPDLDTDA